MDLVCDPMLSQADKEKMILIMSATWDSRNRWAHADLGYDPGKTVEGIAETLCLLEHKREPKTKVQRPPCTWHGPEPGVIKLNSDGAIREEQGIAKAGGVARDAIGFRGAWCRVYQDIADPLSIEALAFRDVVLFASQQGYNRIICETDCEVLVKLWRGIHNQRSVIAPVLSEIEELDHVFF